jgi:uncharacterized protein YndB with AHSA1/START domain
MTKTIAIAPVRKSLTVKAPQAKAFEVFTSGMSRWWPATHSMLKAPFKEAIVEPRAGGRWYHVGEDGSTSETGIVRVWDPPNRLVLVWRLNPKWEYEPDLDTEVEVRFIADGAATKVELEHRYIERMGEGAETARSAVDSPNGWSGLLEEFRKIADGAA